MAHEAIQGMAFATADGVAVKGDLYRPQADGPHPVLVAAPGGGWLRGDKAQLAIGAAISPTRASRS